jgi:hypothetical protein
MSNAPCPRDHLDSELAARTVGNNTPAAHFMLINIFLAYRRYSYIGRRPLCDTPFVSRCMQKALPYVLPRSRDEVTKSNTSMTKS